MSLSVLLYFVVVINLSGSCQDLTLATPLKVSISLSLSFSLCVYLCGGKRAVLWMKKKLVVGWGEFIICSEIKANINIKKALHVYLTLCF